MKGILADVNAVGYIEFLIQRMQAEPWTEFWHHLGLVFRRFEDVGLQPTSSDREVWRLCQQQQLILITDNRNNESADSLEAVIRDENTPDSLPVFTISDLRAFRTSREYVERIIVSLYDYLLRIDELRGTGRLFLP